MTHIRKHPKTGVYYFRRTIPVALRAALGKGSDWYESLRTKSYGEAQKRVKIVGQKVDAAFEEARRKLAETGPAITAAQPAMVIEDGLEWMRALGWTPPAVTTRFDDITLADAEAMAQAWLQDRLREHQERVAAEGAPPAPQYGPVPVPEYRPSGVWPPHDIESFRLQMAAHLNRPVTRTPLEEQIRDVGRTDFHVEMAVWDLARRYGLTLQPDGKAWRFVRNAVLRAERTLRVEVERVNAGDWSLALAPAPVVTVAAPAPAAVVTPVREPAGRGKTFTEVYRMYAAEVGVNPKLALEHKTILARFQDILGGDLPARQITKEHVVEFKSVLFRLPKSLTAEQKKKPLRDVAAETDGKDVGRLTNASVRKSVSIVQTILGWGVKNGLLDSNPAQGVVPAKSKRTAGPARLFFADDDIKTVFSSPIYTGCQSDAKYWEPGSYRIDDERAWLPVLALWTGCRLEELGQLLPSDVKCQDGIYFLDITTLAETEDGPAKRLKNDGSHRRVPLHPEVIRAGFLDYAKKQKGERLFPNLKPDRVGVITSAYSKNFGRYLDRIGLTDSRKTFHSFRHTFKRACRGVIDKEIHAALTGHASGDVGDLYGRDETGAGVPLAVLAEAVAKLEFPGWPADFRRIG